MAYNNRGLTETVADDASARAPVALPMAFVCLLLLVPSAFRFLLGTSSNTAGLVLIGIIILGAAVVTGRFAAGSFGRAMIGIAIGAVVLLLAHLGIAVYLPYIVQEVDVSRTAGSFFALVVMLLMAGVVADWWLETPDRQINRIAGLMRLLLVGIALLCVTGLQPPSPLLLTRPSFPFTEPSHFALVAAPFIIDGSVRAPLVRRLLWLAVWLGLGVANQSLSLVIAVAIAAVVSLPLPYMIVSFVMVAIGASRLDLDYYTDRLDLSANSTNLSALIYRQGWELLHQGLAYSNGWGIGFQQLGFAPLDVPTSDIVYRLLTDDSNLRDGSFTAAKIVSELGILGIAIVALLVVSAIVAGLRLRAMISISAVAQPAATRFAAAVLCGFVAELFVRGIGYFSSTVALAIAAFLVLIVAPRRRKGPSGSPDSLENIYHQPRL